MQNGPSILYVQLQASPTFFMVNRSGLGVLFKGHKFSMVHCGFPINLPRSRRQHSPNTSLAIALSARLGLRFLSCSLAVTSSERRSLFPQEAPTSSRV